MFKFGQQIFAIILGMVKNIFEGEIVRFDGMIDGEKVIPVFLFDRDFLLATKLEVQPEEIIQLPAKKMFLDGGSYGQQPCTPKEVFVETINIECEIFYCHGINF